MRACGEGEVSDKTKYVLQSRMMNILRAEQISEIDGHILSSHCTNNYICRHIMRLRGCVCVCVCVCVGETDLVLRVVQRPERSDQREERRWETELPAVAGQQLWRSRTERKNVRSVEIL